MNYFMVIISFSLIKKGSCKLRTGTGLPFRGLSMYRKIVAS